MARTATTTDVFNAVGDAHRRDILEVLAFGEATVGDVVGRRRYRVNGPAFEPLEAWITGLSRTINEHYDRLDDYLETLQSPDPSHTEKRH